MHPPKSELVYTGGARVHTMGSTFSFGAAGIATTVVVVLMAVVLFVVLLVLVRRYRQAKPDVEMDGARATRYRHRPDSNGSGAGLISLATSPAPANNNNTKDLFPQRLRSVPSASSQASTSTAAATTDANTTTAQSVSPPPPSNPASETIGEGEFESHPNLRNLMHGSSPPIYSLAGGRAIVADHHGNSIGGQGTDADFPTGSSPTSAQIQVSEVFSDQNPEYRCSLRMASRLASDDYDMVAVQDPETRERAPDLPPKPQSPLADTALGDQSDAGSGHAPVRPPRPSAESPRQFETPPPRCEEARTASPARGEEEAKSAHTENHRPPARHQRAKFTVGEDCHNPNYSQSWGPLTTDAHRPSSGGVTVQRPAAAAAASFAVGEFKPPASNRQINPAYTQVDL